MSCIIGLLILHTFVHVLQAFLIIVRMLATLAGMQARVRPRDRKAEGEPVAALLRARGSTKRWLGKKLGIEESLLNKYLSGDVGAPADLYERIADVLHVPVSFVQPDEPVAA
jgi:hypothetical protein